MSYEIQTLPDGRGLITIAIPLNFYGLFPKGTIIHEPAAVTWMSTGLPLKIDTTEIGEPYKIR